MKGGLNTKLHVVTDANGLSHVISCDHRRARLNLLSSEALRSIIVRMKKECSDSPELVVASPVHSAFDGVLFG